MKTENEQKALEIKAEIYDQIAQIGMLRSQIAKHEQQIIDLEAKLAKLVQSDEK